MSPFFYKDKDFFYYWKNFLFFCIEKLLTYLKANYLLIMDPLRRMQIGSIFCIYLFILVTPIGAFESKDYLLIDNLVNRCYKDNESCNSALLTIHDFQRNAAINKKFSCQTRLLGLEANLIMAMNSKLKRNDAKIMIQALKKYC